MKLSKNKLFFGIFIFGIIVNLLVLFDIQYLYIRAILSFVFLTTTPGLLIMLMLRIRKIGFWEYLVYTIGLSVAFLMFGGLFVNWTFPLIGINKPLSFIPLLISFNIFLIIFWLIAYKRNKEILFEIRLPKLDWLNKIFLITPVIFPILSILGAITLNNGGPNYLTMILLSGIAAYVLFVVLFKNKLNENIYPWALSLISVSLVFMGSLRGWYISHTDAALEYSLFKLTLSNEYWNFWLVNNSYNGMLSVTILPTILLNFLKCNEFLIHKLIFPLFFSLVPITMFVLFKKLFNKEVSFFGTLFYVFQPAFTAWTLIPPRQEIAFLFFSLILLVIFSESLFKKVKNTLFLIFGASMIVSHYSTSYVASALFILVSIAIFLYKRWKNREIKTVTLEPENKTHFHLSGLMIIIFLLFECLWYFKITTAGTELVNFTFKSVFNLSKILNQEVYSRGYSPLEFLNALGLLKLSDFEPTKSLSNYIHDMRETEGYKYLSQEEQEELDKYPSFITDTSSLPRKINISLYLLSERTMKILIILGGFLILLGIYTYVFLTKPHDKMLILTSLVFLVSLVAFVVLPFASSDYNLHRMYQQVLVILSVFVVYGISRLFKSHQHLAYFCFSLFILVYFLLLTHVQYYYMGGREVQLRFANIGKDYDLHYVTANEIFSADWLFKNREANSTVVADTYANYKIYQSKYYNFNTNLQIDVLPEVINKDKYVFSSRSNTLRGGTFKYYEGGLLFYNFPTEFLNSNKNLIYNNGGSEVFK